MKTCVKFGILGLLASIPSFVLAGEWTRVDKFSIKFSGEISAGDKTNLLNIIKRTDKRLYLNSEGGDAEEALKIANFLLPYRLHVIVDGYCASSCANYLFTAGNIKEIRNGWVGFHGNMISLYKETRNKIKTMNDYTSIRYPDGIGNMSSQDVMNSYTVFSDSLYDVMLLDHNYFTKIGLKQDFFDLSFKNDKGMNDGSFYEFLLPSPQTFAKYGFKNVKGQQKYKQESVSYSDDSNSEINGLKFIYK
ncbi:hypothetical protein QEJ31_03485 [Pigmentibacter sp. JX0631]|uniref:hypothetical protein n=1 Tax=Pigmentibacter sp. JX0631 TaxID=2976982 RepID=UPI002469A102|nr:hypothetical protein [Pigmentibacter sp. JX0631]WGL60664.1 hypothetical protein QEJ31_03485 [Pigmentibacter sp. JX0631]